MAKPFESRLQDLVYNVEVGIGLRIIKGFLYILFMLTMIIFYNVNQNKGFKNPKAMEYAQLGRNLSQTGTFTTQLIRPASMWFLMEKSGVVNPRIEQHPDILHPPLYPIVLSGIFKLTGTSFEMESRQKDFMPENIITFGIGGVSAMLTGLLLFLLARRMFNAKIALISSTIYFMSDTMLADSISGLPITLVVLFGMASFFFANMAVINEDEGAKKWRIILPILLSAIFCGLAFLTQYAAIILLPGLILYLSFGLKNKGWLWGILTAIIVIGMMAPWIVRNLQISGSAFGMAPYTIFHHTNMYPETSFDTHLTPQFDNAVGYSAIQEKFNLNVGTYYKTGLLNMGDGILPALFFVTFFFGFSRKASSRFRWGVLLSIFFLFIAAGLYGEDAWRIIHVFWPVAIMYGVAFFQILIDRMNLQLEIAKTGLITLLVILSALPMIQTLMPPRATVPYPPYLPPMINLVSGMMDEDELLCTDIPEATAWYANQNSLMLPATLNDFYDINDFQKLIGGLYLSPVSLDRAFVGDLINGRYSTWFPIFRGGIPADFPLIHRIPLDNFRQLFYTDRIRWNN